MKHILLMLCLFTTTATLLSQSKDLAELQNKFWKSSNPKSKVATAPEKWKDESAVILFRDEFYKYTNNGKKMYNPSHFHQRVLHLHCKYTGFWDAFRQLKYKLFHWECLVV